MPHSQPIYLAFGLLALVACGDAERAADLDSQTAVEVDASEMASQLTDRSWAARKVQQRAIVRMTNVNDRRALAGQLVQSAADSSDLDDLHRLVGSAMLADEESAIQAIGVHLDDSNATLEMRFNLARSVMRSERRDAISESLVALSADLMESPERYHYDLALYVRALYESDAALGDIELGLQDSDSERAQAAATALRSGPIPGALPLIESLVDHPEKAMRKRAAQALEHHVHSPAGSALLLGMLESETESVVCVRAIETLEHAEPHWAVDRLIEQYDGTGCGTEHRYVVLSSLRRALRAGGGDADSEAFLLSVVDTAQEPGLQGYAVAALGRVDMVSGLEPVAAYDALTQMTSRSLEPLERRLAAIDALGGLEATGAAQSLQGMLSDIESEPEQVQHVFQVLIDSGKATRDMSMLADPWTGPTEDGAVAASAEAFRTHTLALAPVAVAPSSEKDDLHRH